MGVALSQAGDAMEQAVKKTFMRVSVPESLSFLAFKRPCLNWSARKWLVDLSSH
jgi:hypothetical protein